MMRHPISNFIQATISFTSLLLMQQIILLESKSVASSHNRNAFVSSPSTNFINSSAQNVTKGPPIVNQDSLHTINVLPRDNVELKCPFTSEPPPLYDWFKGKDRIDPSWERFDLSSHHPRNIIYIRSVTHEDEGEYTCEAVNGFGKSSFTIQLFVTGEDPFKDNFLKSITTNRRNGSNNNNNNNSSLSSTTEKPEILKDQLPKEKNVLLHKGSNSMLKCEARGNPRPNITWFKDNILVIGAKPDVSTLKLVNITEADSGLYKCEAVNYFGKSTFEIIIAVDVGAPSKAEIVELSPNNLTLFPGENGSITCVAKFENELQPFLCWVKKIELPSQAHKKHIFVNGSYFEVFRTEIKKNSKHLFTTDLILTNVTRVDAGSYHCFVTGGATLTHSEAHVFVRNDPVQVLSVQLNKDKAIAIQWAVFACFLFVIVVVLILACIYRLYIYRQFKPYTLRQNHAILPVPFKRSAALVRIPERSPGEVTISTTLSPPTLPNNICQPLVADLVTNSSTSTSINHKWNHKKSCSFHPYFKSSTTPHDDGFEDEDGSSEPFKFYSSTNPSCLSGLSESTSVVMPNTLSSTCAQDSGSTRLFQKKCRNNCSWNCARDNANSFNLNNINRHRAKGWNNKRQYSHHHHHHHLQHSSMTSSKGLDYDYYECPQQTTRYNHKVLCRDNNDDVDYDDSPTTLYRKQNHHRHLSDSSTTKTENEGKLLKYDHEFENNCKRKQRLQQKFRYHQPPASPVSFRSNTSIY